MIWLTVTNDFVYERLSNFLFFVVGNCMSLYWYYKTNVYTSIARTDGVASTDDTMVSNLVLPQNYLDLSYLTSNIKLAFVG